MRASACASPGKAQGGTGRTPARKRNRGEGVREISPEPPKRPPTPQEVAKPPTQKAPKTGPPNEHRGITQPKPATPSQEQRPIGKRDTETCRHIPRWRKKKEPAAQPERKGMGGQRPQGPGQGQPATDTSKPNQDTPQKKGKKHTPITQPRRAGHSRDLGQAHTPTHRTLARKGGEQAGRAHKHAPPHSNPKPGGAGDHAGRAHEHTHTATPPQGEAGRSRNPNPSTHAHTAHRNEKRLGARRERTQPHTSHKQAET